jgi:hypothetical protein
VILLAEAVRLGCVDQSKRDRAEERRDDPAVVLVNTSARPASANSRIMRSCSSVSFSGVSILTSTMRIPFLSDF